MDSLGTCFDRGNNRHCLTLFRYVDIIGLETLVAGTVALVRRGLHSSCSLGNLSNFGESTASTAASDALAFGTALHDFLFRIFRHG